MTYKLKDVIAMNSLMILCYGLLYGILYMTLGFSLSPLLLLVIAFIFGYKFQSI